MKLREDGRPGLVVNERMQVFIEGALGGYCYPEKGGEEPLKNEFGHQHEAAQYMVSGHQKLIGLDKPPTQQKIRPKRIAGKIGL